MRLIDRLMIGKRPIGMKSGDGRWARTETVIDKAKADRLLRDLETSPIIVADNIDEFAYAKGLSITPCDPRDDSPPGQPTFETILHAKDVPNIVPPFDRFWVEWKIASPLLRQQGFDVAGALVYCDDLRSPHSTTKSEIPKDVIRFRLTCDFLYTHPDNSSKVAWDDKSVTAFSSEEGVLKGVYIQDEPAGVAHPLLAAVLLSVSFMNCRNVRVIEGPRPNPKLSRSHARKTGKPLVQYKTIDIWPVCKLINKSSPSEDRYDDAKRAMHIVRGHFKKYDGAGLFGRHKGTFFWGQHISGEGSKAQIINDYRIRLDGKAPV